jgi:hypothetical protein
MKMKMRHTRTLWGTAKEVLTGKFTAMRVYIKSTERSQTNIPNATSQIPTKTRKSKTQIKQAEKNINIRTEVNEIETKKTIQRINETKSWFCEKNKQDWQTPGKSD